MTRIQGIWRICGLAAAGLAMAAAPGRPQAETLKLLESWGPSSLSMVFAVTTATDEAKKLSNGAIEIKRFGPEVVPPFEQLQPVSAGTFDMLYTHPIYHAGATAIGALMDIVVGDSETRRAAGIHDWIDDYYQKNHGMKLLAACPSVGYQFLLKQPLKDDEALKGRKIRSTPTYAPLVHTLGGATVTLPVPQIYTSMQKGLIDGAAYVVNSLVKQKFYEVAPYMARPLFGSSNTYFMINLKKWQSLDAKSQQVLIAATRKAEDGMPWFGERQKMEDEEGMIVHGARFTYFDAENARRLTQLFNEGVKKMAIEKSGETAQEFIKLVEAKGLINR
jgi:TRAP-type C4-dicarboxylate transport system substrate-binding protein